MSDLIKDFMRETSEKPDRIPKRLYHATHRDHRESIMEVGLLPHPIFGEIYLCESESQVLKFVPKPCIVFSVETRDLDLDHLFLSKDHVKTKDRNFEAYTYYHEIAPENLKWKMKF